MFKKAFVLTFCPLAILILPLFFHQSQPAEIGPYSTRYFLSLIFLLGVSASLSFWLAAGCAKQENMRPAFPLLIILVSLAAVAFVVESVLRTLYADNFSTYKEWGHKKSALFGFEARPNHRWSAKGAVYTTDADGFRTHVSNPFWREKTDKTQRVFVLGGSSAFGYGLNDDETWPHKLERELERRLPGSPFLIINSANNGHNSLQTFLRFYLRVLPLKPTHVLYYEAINDVSRFPLPPDYVAIAEENLFSESLASYFAKIRRPQNFYSKLLLTNFSANFFSKYKGEESGMARLPDEEKVALETYALMANGQRFLNNVSTLARICQGFGTQLILATFLHDPEKMDPYASRSLQYYNRLLREFAERANLPLVDLEKLFEPAPEKASYFSEDHYHPTSKGTDYIAFSAAEFFVQNLEPLLSQ